MKTLMSQRFLFFFLNCLQNIAIWEIQINQRRRRRRKCTRDVKLSRASSPHQTHLCWPWPPHWDSLVISYPFIWGKINLKLWWPHLTLLDPRDQSLELNLPHRPHPTFPQRPDLQGKIHLLITPLKFLLHHHHLQQQQQHQILRLIQWSISSKTYLNQSN